MFWFVTHEGYVNTTMFHQKCTNLWFSNLHTYTPIKPCPTCIAVWTPNVNAMLCKVRVILYEVGWIVFVDTDMLVDTFFKHFAWWRTIMFPPPVPLPQKALCPVVVETSFVLFLIVNSEKGYKSPSLWVGKSIQVGWGVASLCNFKQQQKMFTCSITIE